MSLSRRAILKALAGGVGVSLGGCLIPTKPGPRIDHANYRQKAPRSGCKSGGLCVGAAAIDLTPPANSKVWLAGFGFQKRMKSIRDPISARCLYFDDGERRVALVVADVIGLMRPSVQRVRRLVGAGVDVAVASTHNHQSPDTMGYWGPAILYTVPHSTGVDPEYLSVFEERLALCVKRAIRDAVPVELAFATVELPDGLVRNLRNPGVYDRAIELVDARRRDGKSVATFVHFGCHVETLGDHNRQLSADFPGPLRQKLEAQRGGTAIFANGALGGMITPDVETEADLPERSALIERIASTVAGLGADALKIARPIPIDRVEYKKAEVVLESDNALYGYVERVGLIEPRQLGQNGAFTTEVGRIDLGPVSWALLPGEPTPMVGLRVKERLRAAGRAHPLVIGLANDELGYLLDPSQYDDPLFEYEATVSPGREAAITLEAVLAELG